MVANSERTLRDLPVLTSAVTGVPAGRDWQAVARRLLLGAWVAIMLLATVLLARTVRLLFSSTISPLLPAIACFGLALVVRLWILTPSLSNWYVEVQDASGAPMWPRFGPGFALYQEFLRSLFPWNGETVFFANAVLGSCAASLSYLFARELGLSRTEATATGMLLAMDPLHAIVSSSPAEHVPGSILASAALLAWTRGVRKRDLALQLLALFLALEAAFYRPDTWIYLGTVPFWSVLRPPAETDRPGGGSDRRRLAALVYWAVWGLCGLLLRVAVIAPSRHPLPRWEDILGTLIVFPFEFFVAAATSPPWVCPLAAILAIGGIVVSFRRAPRLLLTTTLVMAGSFVPLGKHLGLEGPLAARYFLPVIPHFLSFSAIGFSYCLDRTCLRFRFPRDGRAGAAVTVAGLLLLLLSAGALGIPAYRARFTFQDEYAFLRRALAQVPNGCTVVQHPVREVGLPGDPDCCLDGPRSPLVAAFPRLRFELVRDPTLPADGQCRAYYRSAICDLQEGDRRLDGHSQGVLAQIRERCAALEATPGLTLLGRAELSPRSTGGWFDDRPPRVGLWLANRPPGRPAPQEAPSRSPPEAGD